MTLVTLVSLCAASVPVFADESSSAHFMVKDSDTNDFGGYATSSSFSLIDAGGQTQNGTSTSASFVLDAGILFFDSFTPLSQNWRWYDDETNVTPSTALADENTAPINIDVANPLKLRITVTETADIGALDVKFRLQYSTSSDFSTGAYNVTDVGACTGGSVWCYADGGGVDDAIIASSTLSDSGTCLGGAGEACGTHNESGTSASTFDHAAGATVEYEFTIQEGGGAVASTVYFFRLYSPASSSSVPLNTGETFPSLSTQAGALSFVIGGLEAGTSTEGVETDIMTTATAVPFGTLPINSSVEAAQRFTVTANGAGGYSIYTFQNQGLLGALGNEIDPVAATNDTPLGWSPDACALSAAGCYGYHAGDDLLSGGSNRFTADDTYARFTSAAKEIVYNGGPATEEKTDIVYRVYVRNVQESDSYTGNIVYIIVPVF